MIETQDILSRASSLCITFLKSSDRWFFAFDKEFMELQAATKCCLCWSALLLREHLGISTVFLMTFMEVVFDQLVLVFRGGRTSDQPGE